MLAQRERWQIFFLSFFFLKSVLICSDQIHLCFPLTVFWTNWDIFPPLLLHPSLTPHCFLQPFFLTPPPLFSTYSRGVRFPQLVHISAPILHIPPPSAPHLSLSLFSSSYSSTTSCWPLAVLSDQGGFVVSSERSCLTLAYSPHVAHLHSCVPSSAPHSFFFLTPSLISPLFRAISFSPKLQPPNSTHPACLP